MAAGKTLDLIKVAFNYEEKGHKVCIFTSKLDSRSGIDTVSSRTGLNMKATSLEENTDISRLMDQIEHPSCILVDEAQFLTKKQVWQLSKIVDELNIPVICYGLRSDYRGEPFAGSQCLMAIADTIEEIRTICHCGRKATMNMRIVNNKPVYEGDQVIIGGNESYVPVCRKHFVLGEFVAKNNALNG